MKKLSLILASLWLSLVPAAAQQQMPALGAAAAVSGTDLLAIYQGAAPLKKMTAAQMAAYVYGLASGDLTANGTGALTLATVNANVGSFGSATNCVAFTTNGKGLITAASQTTCTPAVASITGLGTGVSTALAAALNSSTGLVGALTATNGNCVVGNGSAWTSTTCPGGTAANPTATAGPTAVNGVASTYMRSDAAPAVQLGTAAVPGIVQPDGTTVSVSAGVISSTPRSAVRATTTTTEAIANSDQNKLVTFSNAGAVACTIAQAGSGGNFFSGWAVSLRNLGAGTVTCTPTTSTVDGAANFTLTTGQGVDLYSDGTNYFTQPGKGGGGTPGGSSGQVQYNNAGAFGGFTASGDATINTSTGAVTTTGLHPGYVSGSWYSPVNWGISQPGAGSAFPANSIACRISFIPRLVTINALGAAISTVGSTNIQLAIYTNSASNRPGTLIGNTGSMINTALGATSAAMAANKQVGPGGADGGKYVWFCVNQNDSTGAMVSTSQAAFEFSALIGDATLANVLSNNGNDQPSGLLCQGANCQGGSSTFGAWPANLTTSTWTIARPGTTGQLTPIIFFKAN